MELTFLGTAASEGYPVAFCGCENCERARALGGPNLRNRSAALVDGELLLDLGPDVMAASLAHGIPLTGVRHCLLTHEHEDHFDASHLLSRSPHCGVTAPRMTLYATAGALAWAANAQARHLPAGGLLDPAVQESLNLAVCPIAPGETFDAGPYRVTAIPAAHGAAITPLLYAIERAGRALFYATDTGALPDAAWAVLADWGGQFDAVVLDHTFGMKARSNGHNNADQFVETVARLRAGGHLAPDCRILAHHLGHHSNPDHDALSRYAAARGYEVAYDGLTVRV
jgi:phosphoribosyl 1,2-cyclic phosphate phosphodiesterase